MNSNNNHELRLKLQEIIDEGNYSKYKEKINNLCKEYEHTIIYKIGVAEIPRGNCHMFALGLIGNSKIEEIGKKREDIFPNGDFIKFLIKNDHLIPKKLNMSEEALIVYFNNCNPTHSGKLFNGRVTSKWGNGHVWEHDTFEVPNSYGGGISIFNKLKSDEALKIFLDYAKMNRVIQEEL